jgi:Zn-dependent peptidase ImmA (M78 family)
VPVEDIADSVFGLLIRDVDDLSQAPGAPALDAGQSLSGLLLPSRGEIWVNAGEAREWPPRRRFTIGHELGHWVMHRAQEQAVYCRPRSISEKERPQLPPPEEEANAFAAALLMPAHLLREQYDRDGRSFERLCAKFGASGAAMGRRLHAVVPRRT